MEVNKETIEILAKLMHDDFIAKLEDFDINLKLQLLKAFGDMILYDIDEYRELAMATKNNAK